MIRGPSAYIVDRFPEKNNAQIVPLDITEPLNAECKHFLKCIESGMSPRTDGNNGVQVLKILNACQESLGKGGVAVHLDGREDSGSDLLMFDVSYGLGKSYPTIPRYQAASEFPANSNLPLSNVFANETAVVDLPCKIGKGTTVGHFSHVMAGAEIGEEAFIGAGAVVSGDVPAHALMLGKPATQQGWMCECSQCLDLGNGSVTCNEC